MDVIQDRELRGITPRTLRALIVANGAMPAESMVRTEIECADYVIAADGGANYLHSRGLACHAVIGDFDSVLADSMPGVERISAPDQDHTDLDKAISHLIDLGYADLSMIGATGNRLDHTYGALEMLAKYGRQIRLRLIDDIGCACLVTEDSTFRTTPGQTVSLLPIGTVDGVATDGLKWAIKNETLRSGVRDGLSNVAVADEVTISVGKGDLIVYLHR